MGRLYGPLRILLVVLAVLTITSSVAFAEGEDEYYLTWEEYITANEIESWNWNDAADAIEIIANHAIELYEAGDQETAYEYAKATYWGYYETTGFERNTMTYISGARVSAVELQFTNFRKSIKKDLGAETVRAEGEGLIQSLHEDALILSPEGSSMDVSSGGFVATLHGGIRLEGVGLGLLITVDEVVASLDEMINLAAVYQLFVREQRRVALVMAGLPNNISALLNDKSVSFLRRAQQHKLDTIPDPDVREAFRETAAIGDRGVTSDALEACVSAIEGYPYMLQLVGFRCWQASNLSGVISAEAAERGIEDAREDFRSHILEPTFRELSEVDVRFIEAMLADDRESRISDVAKRMGVESRYASKYRSRLLAEGVIEQVARGVVRFALPEFKAFVQEELGD